MFPLRLCGHGCPQIVRPQTCRFLLCMSVNQSKTAVQPSDASVQVYREDESTNNRKWSPGAHLDRTERRQEAAVVEKQTRKVLLMASFHFSCNRKTEVKFGSDDAECFWINLSLAAISIMILQLVVSQREQSEHPPGYVLMIYSKLCHLLGNLNKSTS